MPWTVEILNEVVAEELEALPIEMKAKFERIVLLISKNGLNKVGMPYVRHLQDKLWEMRMKGRWNITGPLCDRP